MIGPRSRLLSLFCCLLVLSCGNSGGNADQSVSFDTSAPEPVSTVEGASVTKSKIDFGTHNLNVKVQDHVTVLNSSDADLTLDASLSNGTAFHLLDAAGKETSELSGIAIDAGESLPITVRYLRLSVGTHKATLTLKSQDGGKIEVLLEGRTTAAAEGGEESVVIIPASGSCGSASANQPVDIGEITDGDSAAAGIKICNTGNTEVYLTSLGGSPSATSASLRFLPFPHALAADSADCTPAPDAVSAIYESPALSTSALATFMSLADADGKALAFPLHIPSKSYAKVTATFKPDLSTLVSSGAMIRPTAFELPLIAKTTSGGTATPLRGTLLSKGPKLLINGRSLLENPSLAFATSYLLQDSGASPEAVPGQTLTLKNAGTAPLQVALDLKNAGTLGRFAFDTCPAWPLSLAPGESKSLSLSYDAEKKGTTTGKLNVYSNSVYGKNEVILLVADAEERYLADWQYKKTPLEALAKAGTALDLGQIQAVGGNTEKLFRLGNGSSLDPNTLWSAFTLSFSNPAITLSYSDGTGREMPLASGEPISLSVDAGDASSLRLKFKTSGDGGLKPGEVLTGTLAISNRMQSGFTSGYALPVTLTATEKVVEAGEPIRKAQDVPVIVTNFSMLLLSSSLTDKPVISTLANYRSEAWSMKELDLDAGIIHTNPLYSKQTTDMNKQLLAISSTLMGNCFKKFADEAMAAEDTAHYMEGNGDDKFDFKYKGKLYCIAPPAFSTDGECASGGTLLSEDEYAKIRTDLSAAGCKASWDRFDYIPEITYNYIDVPESVGSYILLDEESGSTSITLPSVRVHSNFAANAESYRDGLIPYQILNQDMLSTFTTDILDDLGSELIADETKAHVDDPSILDATPWVNHPFLKPYIRQKNGNYYFSGSPVDWSTNCVRLAALTYIGGGEETIWFMRQSPSFIFLTVYFNNANTPENAAACSE